MATRTSVQNGDWSNILTWDSGVPVDGDTVIIASGTTVDFDVDQSGFSTGITLRIDGVLTVKSGGNRYMKAAANVTFGSSGTREWRIGSAETPFPATSTFTLNLNGARTVGLTNGKCLWYCAQPTTKYVRLSSAASAGATVLSIDTDVTGESDYWKSGADVRIDHVRKGDVDSEARTISSLTSSTITLSSGLTNSKAAGSLVILITRNIRVIGGTSYAFDQGTSSVIGCEIGCYNGTNYGAGHTISGTISGCYNGTNYGDGHTISGIISGCTNGTNSGVGHTISGIISGCTNGTNSGVGHTISGVVSGCTNGICYGSGYAISGVVSGCTNGIYYGAGYAISGVVSGCTNGICYGDIDGFGATLSSNTNDVIYGGASHLSTEEVRLYNHNGVSGDNRSYTAGGYGATDTSTSAPGFYGSHKLTCTNGSLWNFHQEEITAYPDRPLIVQYAVKNGTTGLTGRGRIELISTPANDPIATGGTPDYQYVAPDDTDWHVGSFFVDVACTTVYKIRLSAKHGSNNVWGAWRVDYLPMEEGVA